ncbi:MAG: hypothetical protein Q8N05_05100 [Bacteroidota bacterium]|nr:hypothetical protein [Bacteroidota bacterium]
MCCIISLTVKARNFWMQFITNNTSGHTAMMLVDQTSENEKANAVFEAINAELSTQSNNSTETFVCKTEADKELEVEAWMTGETYFSPKTASITEETDEALNLEDWMISNVN